MVKKEQIFNDARFFIDDFNLNRIYNERLKSYDVEEICVGDVLRQYGKDIMPLYDTDVYKFLSQSEGSIDAYERYCAKIGMSRRSVDSYRLLIENMKKQDYDIMKGAIFVDQHNLILEGQHRCCIMLRLYGPLYRIKVVRFFYVERLFRPRFFMKLCVARIRNYIYNWQYDK